MIKIGMKVRKQGNKDWYYVRKLFSTFAEIEKLDKNLVERIGSMTEYVDLEKLEEVDEDITGGGTGDC